MITQSNNVLALELASRSNTPGPIWKWKAQTLVCPCLSSAPSLFHLTSLYTIAQEGHLQSILEQGKHGQQPRSVDVCLRD